VTHRKVKHGFWDEDLQAQIDATPFPSAEDQFFDEPEEKTEHCTHDELYGALKTLTARQNFVVRLYYGVECEAMTIPQIASLMGIHHTTVGEHLQVARVKLLAILDPSE
jgi:DNA-directed RNA polymerase specialized sigma24 family protein